MSPTESETICVLAKSRSLLASGNAASSPLADASITSPLGKAISVVEARKRHVTTIRNKMRGTRGSIDIPYEHAPVPGATRILQEHPLAVCHLCDTPGGVSADILENVRLWVASPILSSRRSVTSSVGGRHCDFDLWFFQSRTQRSHTLSRWPDVSPHKNSYPRGQWLH